MMFINRVNKGQIKDKQHKGRKREEQKMNYSNGQYTQQYQPYQAPVYQAPPSRPVYQAPPSPPKLRRKKGYVAPIVWLIIGAALSPWIVGIPIVILALIALSVRVSRNKKIEVDNAQTAMQYSAQYGGRSPYY